ncbi:MAG TPA: type 4a pilus biogenesis protein PilO [Kofleriaceae bacterium]
MAFGADFARMPTRQKVMVFVLIGGLLGALYWQFVYKGLEADLTAAQNENKSKKALNKKLEADIPEFERLNTDMARLTRIIEENQKALPSEAELPAFFETLNRKILESGIEVIRSKQGKEEPIETFYKVPIEYEIHGTYVQIKKFFASLVPKKKKPGLQVEPVPGEQAVEERERIVSIENLVMSAPFVRNREIRLTAKFTASTYRQEEKKDPAAKPGAAPAKPGAAPTSPAAAGTPKGAKAMTEEAIDKGDKKDRDAAGVNEAKTPASGVERMKEGK